MTDTGREVLYGAFAVEGCHLCTSLGSPIHVHVFNRDADGNEVLTAVRRAKPAAPTLIGSGVDYCRTHRGIRNEDEKACDTVLRDPFDKALNCPTCEGHGYLVHPEDGEDEPCDDCEEGVTPCDLTPLLYEPAASSEGPRGDDR